MICDPLSRIGGMSRKRFRPLADALQRKAPTFASSDAEVALFTQVVNDIAIACRQTNPRFDRGRFEAASGLVEL
jgi:hypothetical protein